MPDSLTPEQSELAAKIIVARAIVRLMMALALYVAFQLAYLGYLAFAPLNQQVAVGLAFFIGIQGQFCVFHFKRRVDRFAKNYLAIVPHERPRGDITRWLQTERDERRLRRALVTRYRKLGGEDDHDR